MILFLAFRNLILQKKRYALLSFAIFAGFILVTVVTGIVLGALETVKDKGARYFSGHVNVIGYNSKMNQEISDPIAVIKYLKNASLGIRTISARTLYYRNDCTVFFSGQTIRQRRVVGIDSRQEMEEFNKLTFLDGGMESMIGSEGKNGVLISSVASRLLGAKVGDDINIFLTTDTGQYNSATLFVRGIFEETSIFGYVLYMQRSDLNRLLSYREDAATDLAIYAKTGMSSKTLTANVREKLAERYSVFPQLVSRKDLATAVYSLKAVNNNFAVLSLDAQLAQIKDIMEAILGVTYFVLGAFVLIVMVGILNTYRILVFERTKEIGTIRALGMHREAVARLFLLEAAGLGLFSSICGLIMGFILLILLSFVNLGNLPAAGMFTNSGHLNFFIDIRFTLINLAVMTGAVMGAAWGPARSASQVLPAEALRTDF